jgi:hypothetical protein
MAYDLLHTFSTTTLQKPVTPGFTVTEEGTLLQAVLSGGVECVQLATANTGLALCGFAISDNQSISIMPAVETGTIPLTGPYTIQLSNNNLVGTVGTVQMRVVDNAGAITFSQQTDANTTLYWFVTPSTGLVTFNSNQAGVSVTMTYRYNVTVAQAQQKYFQRNINNQAGAVFNTVAVLAGIGEIWTSEFDATSNWAASNIAAIYSSGTVALSTAGVVSLTNSTATQLPATTRVVHIPDTTSPFLGLAFNFVA